MSSVAKDWRNMAPRIILTGCILAGLAALACAQTTAAQSMAAQSMVSASPIKASPATPELVREEALEDGSEKTLDPASLLPDLPNLPPRKATLIGGVVEKFDRVQDRLTIQVFGGGRMKVLFDPRTRIYRNGVPASTSDLRPGDRIYVDTILDGSSVFARNIRLKTSASASNGQGVVDSYRADKQELVVRDALSPQPVNLRITPDTHILQNSRAVSADQLVPGTLIAMQFGSQQDGQKVAQEISVLAVPGTSFTFVGHVAALDLSVGLLVITSSTDGKTYEIHLDSSAVPVDDSLHQMADVTVVARFDGSRYEAQRLTVNSKESR